MSTNWGYACVTHDPPIYSDDHWFNHGEDLLRAVLLTYRRGEWPNDPDQTARDVELLGADPAPVEHRGYKTWAPITFLRQHPKCEVVIVSEYNDVIDASGRTVAGLVSRNTRRSVKIGAVIQWVTDPWPPDGERECTCEVPVSAAPWHSGDGWSRPAWTRCRTCGGMIEK